jgi:hypothetical protein
MGDASTLARSASRRGRPRRIHGNHVDDVSQTYHNLVREVQIANDSAANQLKSIPDSDPRY